MEHRTSWLDRVKSLFKKKQTQEPPARAGNLRPIDVGGDIVRHLVDRADLIRMIGATPRSVSITRHSGLSSHQVADGVRSFLRRERKNPSSPYGLYKAKCHIIDADAVRITLSKEIPF